MPKTSIISEGKTTNEAIEKGLKDLKVTKNMVNIKVLEDEQKRSFFSILAPRVVRVELTLKEEAKNNLKEETSETTSKTVYAKKEKKQMTSQDLEIAEKNVKKFLDEFLNQISNDLTYKITKDEMGLEIIIDGKEAGTLIGYRGEILNAMQSLISAIASKELKQKVRIILDIQNYREKREKALKDLAIKISKTVEKNRKPITLEPMSAYERKIIHSTLQDSTTVRTESIGEEPRRRVVVKLK